MSRRPLFTDTHKTVIVDVPVDGCGQNPFNGETTLNFRTLFHTMTRFLSKQCSTTKVAILLLIVFSSYYLLATIVLNLDYRNTKIVYDLKGNVVLNPFDLSDDWNALIDIEPKSQRKVVNTKPITMSDVEGGYISTYIHKVGHKNVSLSSIQKVLKNGCNGYMCIGTSYILLHSNIVYLPNISNSEYLLIEPKVDAQSELMRRVYPSNKNKRDTGNHKYAENWRDVPGSIIVEFINQKGLLSRKEFTGNTAGCVYLTIKENGKYILLE